MVCTLGAHFKAFLFLPNRKKGVEIDKFLAVNLKYDHIKLISYEIFQIIVYHPKIRTTALSLIAKILSLLLHKRSKDIMNEPKLPFLLHMTCYLRSCQILVMLIIKAVEKICILYSELPAVRRT